MLFPLNPHPEEARSAVSKGVRNTHSLLPPVLLLQQAQKNRRGANPGGFRSETFRSNY